jgi:reverse transcriptase-like protein
MRHGSGVRWWAKRPWAAPPRGRRTIGAPSAGLSLGGLRARRARLRFARPQRCTATSPARQEQAARRVNPWMCHGHEGRTRCSEGSLVFCLDKGVHFTLTWISMSPQLRKVAERAKTEPDGQFHSLAHLLDEPALYRAYYRQRENAAVGVDGITKEHYGQDLADNLRDLHQRLRTKRYRHQPIRRVHIPKDNGKTRPLGISAFEDKIVQDALREVLQAIYEQDFLDCSYGFRPGRSAHDAVRALHQVADKGEMNCVLEADIRSFFDCVDRTALVEMLRERVADGSLLRLVSKCLHVGVLDGEGILHTGGGYGPGVDPVTVAGQHLSALRARPVVHP